MTAAVKIAGGEIPHLNKRIGPDGAKIKRQYAADSTVDALMYSLRGGTTALARPDVLRRLSALSDKQLREMMARLQKLKPEIAPAWTPEDLKLLIETLEKTNAE